MNLGQRSVLRQSMLRGSYVLVGGVHYDNVQKNN